jgi:hypothetical protein
MNRSIARKAFAAVTLLVAASATIRAQQPMTVAGYVTSRGAPLAGARVRVDELALERQTDASGRYSFVIPSMAVRGQTVHVSASKQDRRTRFIPKASAITLAGGALALDFDLAVAAEGQVIPALPGAAPAKPTTMAAVSRAEGDSVDLSGTPGAVDIASALAGRIPGLLVIPATSPGGSALLVYRGPRALLTPSQPLFVLDGLPLDNTVYASAAQRFGVGGFDYGSALAEVDLHEIATIRLVAGAEASRRFGGRGANGVIEMTTRNGAADAPFGVSATYQQTGGDVGRLPDFQNRFGQGLKGAFSFFDGKGGGTNDATDQSWGPALDGRPLAQASYTEAARPEIRLWSARPNNVKNYFASGSTTEIRGAVQGGGSLGSMRAFVGNRSTKGITPRDELSRLTGGFSAAARPFSRLELSAFGLGGQAKNSNAPGTGFNEGNPVSQFTRMGRQVDTDSLRRHLRDASGKQVSWIYVNHNNPYFATLADSNYSRRYHGAGGGSATYAVSTSLRVTAGGGVDYYRDGRLFTIGNSWVGGFPSYTGVGNFSKGGSEGDEISFQQSTANLRADWAKTLAAGSRMTVGIGLDQLARKERIRALGVDSALHVPSAGAPDTARIPSLQTWIAHSRTTGGFAESGLTLENGTNVTIGVRNEWSAIVPGQHATALYPSVRASTDLVRAMPSLRDNKTLRSVSLHGEWWQAGNDQSPYTLQTMYASRSITGAVAPLGSGLLTVDPNLSPEKTSGLAVGGDLMMRAHRIGVGLTFYSERTSNVAVPVPDATIGAMAMSTAEISNSGIEATLTAGIGDADRGFAWDLLASATKNSNTVEALSGSASSLPLGPSQWGLSVQARVGQPLGVLMGYGFARNGSGLILRNGLPVADSAAGLRALGVAQPDWSFTFRNTLQYRWLSVSAIADARMGGSLFSGTNRWGNYSGTFATTAFRPDSGLLVVGTDAVTGGANTQHVSAEDYFHALGAIQEAWIYSATFVKLREARVTIAIPTTRLRLPFARVAASLVGRNLYLSTDAPNIDPESVFSPYQLRGVEMGQLPATKSVGFQLTVTP